MSSTARERRTSTEPSSSRSHVSHLPSHSCCLTDPCSAGPSLPGAHSATPDVAGADSPCRLGPHPEACTLRRPCSKGSSEVDRSPIRAARAAIRSLPRIRRLIRSNRRTAVPGQPTGGATCGLRTASLSKNRRMAHHDVADVRALAWADFPRRRREELRSPMLPPPSKRRRRIERSGGTRSAAPSVRTARRFLRVIPTSFDTKELVSNMQCESLSQRIRKSGRDGRT